VNNFQNLDNQHRRFKAHVSVFGTTQLHLRSPYVIAWWSAAFPGFGHLLLSKYLRGFALFIWEVVVNYNAKINLALVDTFSGHIALAKHDIQPRWMLMYLPVYLFAIWDSYRTTVDLNNLYLLAEREDAPYNTFSIGSFEINYLDKRNPVMSVVWSVFMPGLGQLHIHRIPSAFFTLIWSITFLYASHVLEAVQFLFFGEIHKATQVLNKEWLLFIPSMWVFSIYESYVNTVENNKLFGNEQARFLIRNYQCPQFTIKRRIR